MSGDMDRDDKLTADIVRLAARHWGNNPEPILGHAAARTLPGPVRQGWTRDLTREAEEELADAINYIPWEIAKQQQLGANHLGFAQQHYLNAVSACVYAYEQLRAAREALTDERCNRCGGAMLPEPGEFVPVMTCRSCGRTIPR